MVFTRNPFTELTLPLNDCLGNFWLKVVVLMVGTFLRQSDARPLGITPKSQRSGVYFLPFVLLIQLYDANVLAVPQTYRSAKRWLWSALWWTQSEPASFCCLSFHTFTLFSTSLQYLTVVFRQFTCFHVPVFVFTYILSVSCEKKNLFKYRAKSKTQG